MEGGDGDGEMVYFWGSGRGEVRRWIRGGAREFS